MRALAYQIIDLGADLYWGHSNHTPQGIELYKGKAILYSTGDFIDDYAVDSAERNDLSFLMVLELDRNRIVRIVLHPCALKTCMSGWRRTRRSHFCKGPCKPSARPSEP